MSDNRNDYGLLICPDAKLYRPYFKECCKLLGINCIYRAPKKGKEFDHHGELDTSLSKYEEPITVGCIFNDHPDQKSLKKMGWVAELQESSSIIHVPYDLPNLQVGALFEVPSGIDTAPTRMFRVISMANIMAYPASIACEIAPEYFDNMEAGSTNDFNQETFTILKDLEGDD